MINKFIDEMYYYGLTSSVTLSQLKIGYKYANGCGTKISWWVPDKILGISITTACDIHDIECQLATSKPALHKASVKFYDNMQKIIKIESLFLFYPRIIIANLYVKAVNHFWLDKYAEERFSH